MRLSFGIVLLAVAQLALATGPKLPLHVAGTQIVDSIGKPVIFRGFNVCWWIPPTADDADHIKALGGNCVRCMFGYTPQGKFDPAKLSFLKEQVQDFTSRGLMVIPVIHDFRKDKKGPYDDPQLEKEFLDMWDWVIALLKDDQHVVAWEPINEPHDSPADKVSSWYKRVVAHFRALDRRRPIVVEGTGYSWPQNLEPGLKQDDRNIIYSFHTYGPWEYTAQEKGKNIPYPGKWTRKELADAIMPALEFRDRFHVPVWCGEFGVPTYCPGYREWIADVMSILEADGLPWTYWGWAKKPASPTDETFDVNASKPEVYEAIKALFRKYVGG